MNSKILKMLKAFLSDKKLGLEDPDVFDDYFFNLTSMDSLEDKIEALKLYFELRKKYINETKEKLNIKLWNVMAELALEICD